MAHDHQNDIAIIILAAGKSSRAGGFHKLLAQFDGVPLVRKVALQALKSEVGAVCVVMGHRSGDVEATLCDLPLKLTSAPNYEAGISQSLLHGIAFAMDAGAEASMILLADMPFITSDIIRDIADRWRRNKQSIVRACHGVTPLHPLVLPAALFPRILRLTGDAGAKHIIAESGLPLIRVDLEEKVGVDVDTIADVVSAGGRMDA